MSIEKEVKKLIEPTIIEHNYIIEKIEYVKEGNIYFLRVIIGKNGVIDVEDCVEVSKLINPILDEKDLIEENYILDVCSNGGYYE